MIEDECVNCADIVIHSRLGLNHAHAIGDYYYSYKPEDDIYIISGKYPEHAASGTWADMVKLAHEIIEQDARRDTWGM
jgi:hypothetical protein